MTRFWSQQAQAAVRRELERVGLRVLCLGCDVASRHFPQDGRLRELVCYRCQRVGTTRSLAWVQRFPTLAETARRGILGAVR